METLLVSTNLLESLDRRQEARDAVLGLDVIDLTWQPRAAIQAFERIDWPQRPWIWGWSLPASDCGAAPDIQSRVGETRALRYGRHEATPAWLWVERHGGACSIQLEQAQ